MKKVKICFASSTGGHYEEIIMLKPLMEKYDSFFVTEKTSYDTNMNGMKMYYLKQVNRKEISFPFIMIINTIRSLKIYLKEKPDLVITTGVLAIIPLCLIMKLFKKKIIFIETLAKSTSPTLTGKLMYKYADQFYVQWESMLEVYPNAIYVGSVF